MYIGAPALKATTPPVLMVWLRACHRVTKVRGEDNYFIEIFDGQRTVVVDDADAGRLSTGIRVEIKDEIC
jgi:hypothetical protein